MGTVIDGNGAVVGESLSTLPVSITAFIVRIDGGIFFYYPNGIAAAHGHRVLQGRRMRGHGYARASSRTAGSVARQSVVPHGVPGGLAHVGTGDGLSLRFDLGVGDQRQFYSRGSDGVCAASGGVYTGYTVPLVPVTAPPDHPGPLKVV